MHNTTINATTNGTGAVANMTYQTLYQYFLKGSKGITEYKVPTLEEVLDAAKGKIYVCVDVKEKGLLGKIIKTVAEKGMIDQVCYYTGSSTSYIEEMNTINPGAIPFPWVSTAAEVKVLAKYYSKVQMVQFGIDNASLTELMGAIKDAKLVGYANHLDWDSNIQQSLIIKPFINPSMPTLPLQLPYPPAWIQTPCLQDLPGSCWWWFPCQTGGRMQL